MSIDIQDRLRYALTDLMQEPHGCAFCDYGVLRDPAKEHDEACEWEQARRVLADAEAAR